MAVKPAHLSMHVDWREAGRCVRSVVDVLSRSTGIAPSVAVEPVPYALRRGIVVGVHATAWVGEDVTADALVDSLLGLGAVAQGWPMLGGYTGPKVNVADPTLAVLVAQVRCAEVWAHVCVQRARDAFWRGWDDRASWAEADELLAWAGETRAALGAMGLAVP